ncbi:HD domain-containing protein [Pseudodesulfovibrio sp.]|uniref:HD domain-containing protein n=1 Tax=unclassified Pseudodesulfovibrio TaxID=2661612 RepID=UPI003B0000DF
MNQDMLAKAEEWLNAHAAVFRAQAGEDAPLIDRKIRHTMRVLGHVRGIARELPDRPDLVALAELAAILHDAGRFPQLVRQKTYDDRAGYNHAAAGAEIVAASGVLDPLPENERALMLDAIRHHNAAVPPDDLSPDTKIVLEAVRNADKLDAIRNNLKYLNPEAPHGKALKLGVKWDPESVSKEVLQLVRDRQLIPFPAIKWSNDFVLFLCCWIYDLHYRYSFGELQRSGNYEALLAKLPDNDAFSPVKLQLRGDLVAGAASGRAVR